jgi:hypothetical protein
MKRGGRTSRLCAPLFDEHYDLLLFWIVLEIRRPRTSGILQEDSRMTSPG